MKALLLSLFTFTMSVTPSQFPVINQSDLDGSETLWAQKGGIDYKLSLTNVKQYGGCDVYCTSLVIPTASVLTLNGTPLEIVAAPGAGYMIEALSAIVRTDYNSVAYATNTTIQVITATATHSQLESDMLAFTSDITRKLGVFTSATLVSMIVENQGLQVKVKTGNPTAGNSDIEIYVYYRIVTI